MRTQPSLAENVVIIEPGSYNLRIGRAIENFPKKFPHCIARKPKPGVKPILEPVIPRHKPDIRSIPFQQSIRAVNFDANKLLKITNTCTTPDEQSCELEWVSFTNDDHKQLFEWEVNSPSDRDYFALNEALLQGKKAGYHLSWPFRYGYFSTAANYTSVLQDLDDIWTFALEKHVGIPRSSFNAYRVILIIGDVHKRNEIRHLTHLLLDRMKFSRIFIHQASVCTTYGVGLPTACVINIGDQKTSVCCIEDGVVHGDARVNLSIGRSDVVRIFHALLLPYGTKDCIDLSYDRPSDVQDLRSALDAATATCMDILGHTTHEVSQAENHSIDSIHVPFTWNYEGIQCGIAVDISKVIVSNLTPFAAITDVDIPTRESCTLPLPCNQSSENDDPFDDLYVMLTTRERRKRGTGNIAAPNDQTTNQPDTEVETQEMQTTNGNNPLPSATKPKSFISLPEAVWWSICQCTNFVNAQTTAETGQSNMCFAGAGEEIRRRLLSCILLVGGGASGIVNHLLEKWLTERLIQIVHDRLNVHNTVTHVPSVEVISQPEPADLAWYGARLVLTTDSLHDLWITQGDWRQFGSRIIREKAPFLW